MKKTLMVLGLLALSAVAGAQTEVKPGFNLFSVQQDVEIGKQSAVEAERQLPILNDSSVEDYVDDLVERLGAAAPGAQVPLPGQGGERHRHQRLCAARRVPVREPRAHRDRAHRRRAGRRRGPRDRPHRAAPRHAQRVQGLRDAGRARRAGRNPGPRQDAVHRADHQRHRRPRAERRVPEVQPRRGDPGRHRRHPDPGPRRLRPHGDGQLLRGPAQAAREGPRPPRAVREQPPLPRQSLRARAAGSQAPRLAGRQPQHRPVRERAGRAARDAAPRRSMQQIASGRGTTGRGQTTCRADRPRQRGAAVPRRGGDPVHAVHLVPTARRLLRGPAPGQLARLRGARTASG